MRKVLLAIAVLSAAVPFLASCGKEKEPVEVKIMSSNVRYGTADDGDNSWEFRKGAFPAMLADQKPDAFGVQEALKFQLDYFLETNPTYKCVGVGREDGVDEGEHMSIFYNTETIELLDWGTYWLSETPDVPSKGWDAACYRTATWTKMRVKASGKEFFYVNTHLDHKGKLARKNGLAVVVDRIAAMNPKNLPMVLTGDLNVYPDDECLTDLNKIMSSARVTAEDSDSAGSYNAWGERSGVIDYVYYAGFEKAKSFKVVNQSYAGVPYISDHFPVIATLVF